MSVGTLCEFCHAEVEDSNLEKRFVPSQLKFLSICESCRKKHVTYSVEEWMGDTGSIAI